MQHEVISRQNAEEQLLKYCIIQEAYYLFPVFLLKLLRDPVSEVKRWGRLLTWWEFSCQLLSLWSLNNVTFTFPVFKLFYFTRLWCVCSWSRENASKDIPEFSRRTFSSTHWWDAFHLHNNKQSWSKVRNKRKLFEPSLEIWVHNPLLLSSIYRFNKYMHLIFSLAGHYPRKQHTQVQGHLTLIESFSYFHSVRAHTLVWPDFVTVAQRRLLCLIP